MHLLKSIDEVAYQALHEDLGDGDLTANLLPEDAQIKARLITREMRYFVAPAGSIAYSGNWIKILIFNGALKMVTISLSIRSCVF